MLAGERLNIIAIDVESSRDKSSKISEDSEQHSSMSQPADQRAGFRSPEVFRSPDINQGNIVARHTGAHQQHK